jgi:L-aspartate oxidase
MSRYAGIGREQLSLLDARARAAALSGVAAPAVSRWSVETANLVLAGSALLAAAAERVESRGCHVRTDHPDRRPAWERSVLVRQVRGEISTEVADLRPAVAWA